MLGYTADGSRMVWFFFADWESSWQKTVYAMFGSGVQRDGSVSIPDFTRCANSSHLALRKFHFLTSFVGIGSTGLCGVINEGRC